MTGRQEYDNKIKKRNKGKLTNAPEYMLNWYNYLKSIGCSEITCNDYLNKVFCFLKYINYDINKVKLHNIKLQDIVNYMSDKTEVNGGESSDSYKQCVWSALNNFFGYCCKNDLVKENYVQQVKRSKNHDLERIKVNRIKLDSNIYADIIENVKSGVGTDKAKKFQEEMKNRDLLIFLLLMTTGMRKTALIQINVSDIDLSNNTIFVTDKGKKHFTYKISEETEKYLKLWLQDHNKISNTDALFITNKGSRISGSTLDKIIDKYASCVVGKHMSPHKFRSGYVTQVFEKTGNIEFARRAVGHSNVSTTQRYIATENNEMEIASQLINSMIFDA